MLHRLHSHAVGYTCTWSSTKRTSVDLVSDWSRVVASPSDLQLLSLPFRCSTVPLHSQHPRYMYIYFFDFSLLSFFSFASRPVREGAVRDLWSHRRPSRTTRSSAVSRRKETDPPRVFFSFFLTVFFFLLVFLLSGFVASRVTRRGPRIISRTFCFVVFFGIVQVCLHPWENRHFPRVKFGKLRILRKTNGNCEYDELEPSSGTCKCHKVEGEYSDSEPRCNPLIRASYFEATLIG